MAWLFGNDSEPKQAHDEVMNAPHKAQISHELIAAAASYEAAKAYENHVAKNGKPSSHAQAKEIFAGLAGAFVDRVIETKGLDYMDGAKAKRQAAEQYEAPLEQHYNTNWANTGTGSGSYSDY